MKPKYGENLEFHNTVTEVFSFLEEEYGFRVRPFKEYEVIYAKSSLEGLVVTFDIEPPLMSVDVTIRRILNEISLGNILSVRSPSDARNSGLHARTHEILVAGLTTMAKLMREYADDILRGDRRAFKEIYRVASEESRIYTLNCMYGPTRKKANIAWREKQYDKALELYQAMEEALTVTEMRRLRYLRGRKLH